MSEEGKRVSLNRVDKGGGHFPSGLSGALNPTAASALSQANPGVITLVMPEAIRRYKGVLGPGPWSATIAGVTGDDEATINGARTLTRTGDFTASIGVDTSLLIFDALTAVTVDGLKWVDNDDNVPSRESYDYSRQ